MRPFHLRLPCRTKVLPWHKHNCTCYMPLIDVLTTFLETCYRFVTDQHSSRKICKMRFVDHVTCAFNLLGAIDKLVYQLNELDTFLHHRDMQPDRYLQIEATSLLWSSATLYNAVKMPWAESSVCRMDRLAAACAISSSSCCCPGCTAGAEASSVAFSNTCLTCTMHINLMCCLHCSLCKAGRGDSCLASSAYQRSNVLVPESGLHKIMDCSTLVL